MSEVNYICRLCSADVKEDGLSIFGDQGQQSFLQSKIKLYLHFSVVEDDDLPNFLCSTCFDKLESIHTFASMALCMQKHLRSQLGLQALHNDDVPSPDSLLQSVLYLPSEQPTNLEPEEGKDEVEGDYEVMEMEINPMSIFNPDNENSEVMEMEINPMSILYPGDENSDPADEKSDEEVETNHPKMSRKKHQPAEKPHVCMYCSRRFVLEMSLWNHLWLHKDKSRPRQKIGRTRKKQLSRLNKNSQVSNKKGKKRKGEEVGSIAETEEINKMEADENGVETKNGLEADESRVRVKNGDKHKPETEEPSETEPEMTKGVENYVCGVCKDIYESQRELESHLVIHHVEGKFGCCSCCRVFRSKESLELHEANHQARDYTCNQCGRVYSTRSSLNSHLVTHSNVRSHKCSLCPKTFKRNQDLKFHLNQHTGERPYKCTFCPKAFASSANCSSHRKRMHPESTQQATVLPVNSDVQE